MSSDRQKKLLQTPAPAVGQGASGGEGRVEGRSPANSSVHVAVDATSNRVPSAAVASQHNSPEPSSSRDPVGTASQTSSSDRSQQAMPPAAPELLIDLELESSTRGMKRSHEDDSGDEPQSKRDRHESDDELGKELDQIEANLQRQKESTRPNPDDPDTLAESRDEGRGSVAGNLPLVVGRPRQSSKTDEPTATGSKGHRRRRD